VLFDIDWTLLMTDAGGLSFPAALAQAFGVFEPGGSVPFSGRTDRAVMRDLFTLYAIPPTWEHCRRFMAAYLEHLAVRLRTCPGRVLPGARPLLEWLLGREGIEPGILTGNMLAGARLKLIHSSLDHYFAFGGFGDDHLDRCDVARAAAEAGCRHLGGRPVGAVWVVGDSPVDVRCARSIGARAVAVATGVHTVAELVAEGPDVVVASLEDPALFEALVD
jgi:phosphoglycolate phosphatase-like HAD superfamily hydrolase